MSRRIFPYGIRYEEDGRVEVFPAADLIVLGKNQKGMRSIFYIDSGATTSMLPLTDAELLGLKAERGKKMLIRGVTGEATFGYRHEITIQLNGTKLKIPALFAKNDSAPRILGREGVFDKFGIMFDEEKRRVAFLNFTSERRRIDTVFGEN